MIKIVPSSNSRMTNGVLELSSPRIIRTFDTVKLPRDLTEKLFHMALDNRSALWRMQSSHLLTACSEPSTQYIATLRRYGKDLQTFIEKRFESHLSTRINTALDRFAKDPRFFPETEQEAHRVLATYFDFSLRR